MGRNSSYLAGFLIFDSFHGSKKNFNQLTKKKKKKILKIFLSSIKTKVAIKFLENFFFFFFFAKNQLGIERAKSIEQLHTRTL